MGRTDSPITMFRVSFTARLANAAFVSPDAPLPPFRRPSPPAPITQPLITPLIPQNLSDTAIGRDMAADRKMIQTTLSTIQAKVAELSRQQAANMDGLQNAAVELALTIATRLLHRMVTADEFPVEAMVRDMAAELVNDTPVTVWLNPDDLKLLERRLGGQQLLSGDAPKLVADASLERCECRVEGGNGSLILSDPARHLAEIRDDLLRNLADARNA